MLGHNSLQIELASLLEQSSSGFGDMVGIDDVWSTAKNHALEFLLSVEQSLVLQILVIG